MSDLIDRQAAIDAIEFGITYAKAINKETGEVKELFQASNDELRKAEDRIKQLPSAQQKGKWIYLNGLDAFECSVCGRQMVRNIFDYCPWCGAEMTKGEEDE